MPKHTLSGSSEPVEFEQDVESAQGFDLHDPGIILFEFVNTFGNAVQYRSSEPDLSEAFVTNVGSAPEESGISTVLKISNLL